MKILHVIPAIAPRYGGPSALVLEMCRALIERGHQAEIVTSDADGNGRLDLPCHRAVEYQGVITRFFPRRFSEAFKPAPGMGAWLRAHVADYDLVHIHAIFSWSSIVAAQTCRARSVPYILRPLGSLDPWSLTQKPRSKRVLRRIWVDRMLAGAERIHYTSALEQRAAESALVLPLGVIIPNAVSIPELPEEPGAETLLPAQIAGLENQPYMLFVGRLHPKKKLEAVISAFSQIAANIDLHLVIAGDGDTDYRHQLSTLAAQSAASDRIHFTGWVAGSEKQRLIQGCQLLVLVSENENYGIAAVEAMALAKPVLVNHGVYLYPDIDSADAGWVVDSLNDLPDLMHSALIDTDAQYRKGQNARELVKRHFSWSSIVPLLEKTYLECNKPDQ